jgi:AraC-like DNA-binding protein
VTISDTRPQPLATADISAASANALNFTDFRTAVSDSFVPLHVSTDRADRFWGTIRTADAGDVHVSEIRASGHTVERTPELIARSDRNQLKLSIQLAGTGILIQENREAVLQPGDLALYDTHQPYSLCFDDDFRSMVIMFPRHLIDLPPEVVSQLTAVRMSSTQGVGNLVMPFLTQMASNLDQLSGATGSRIAQSALDLVTTMFASELDSTIGHVTSHQALMQRIRDFIDANLSSTDLGPAQIAAAHFISTRHLHAIFHEHGTTVSAWIRTRRLERCRRDLLNPAYADRPVAAIAARWGFVEAAHFSRIFKVAFAESPSDVRFAARNSAR